MVIRIFLIAFFFNTSQWSFAQLTKAEKKEWKKQAKSYMQQPQNLKLLSDQKVAADSELKQLKQESKELNNQLTKKDDQIAELEELISRVRVDAAVAKAELEKYKAGMLAASVKPGGDKKSQGSSSSDFNVGIVFKVQVGAFRNKDLSKYFNNNPNFGGEAGKEPTDPQRINIGIFRNYWEADKFKKYLREMGVKDAWIVPYRDGIRVELKEVLDQVVNQ